MLKRAGIALCVLVGFTNPNLADDTDTTIAAGQTKPGPRAPGFNDPFTPAWEVDQQRDLRRLTEAQERNIVNKAFPRMAVKWPNNFVPVCWENPTPDDLTERTWVEAAVKNSWEVNSLLKFGKIWGECRLQNEGIRIRISQGGPRTAGLGNELNAVVDGMSMNFGFRFWRAACRKDDATRKLCIESIAIHEFGHAIGFSHEQNRPDTQGECAERRQGPDGDTTAITPWDPKSVMNYCNLDNISNVTLSEFDIKAVRYVYGDPQ